MSHWQMIFVLHDERKAFPSFPYKLVFSGTIQFGSHFTSERQLGHLKKKHWWVGITILNLFHFEGEKASQLCFCVCVEHAVLSTILANQSVMKDSCVRSSTTINWHSTNDWKETSSFEASHLASYVSWWEDNWGVNLVTFIRGDITRCG